MPIFIAKALAIIARNRTAQLALIVLLVAIGAFTVAKCTGGNRKEAAQAELTTRSGEAIANAAQDAVETVSNRSEADLAIDAAVAQTKKEIGNAKDAAAVRAAVVRGLCARPEYRSDPACRVRQADSK